MTSARPECAPLRDNRQQLLEFEMRMRGKNTMHEDSARLVPCSECSHSSTSLLQSPDQISIPTSESQHVVETATSNATTDSTVTEKNN